jgi:hypothetical protein
LKGRVNERWYLSLFFCQSFSQGGKLLFVENMQRIVCKAVVPHENFEVHGLLGCSRSI